MDAVFGIENDFDVGGYFTFEMLFGDIFFKLVLELGLAVLQRNTVQGGFERYFQAAVGIGRDEMWDADADATFLESDQEPAPVDFGLEKGTTDAENHAFTLTSATP